jgi:hypothetical protein
MIMINTLIAFNLSSGQDKDRKSGKYDEQSY